MSVDVARRDFANLTAALRRETNAERRDVLNAAIDDTLDRANKARAKT
jgi:hypothetical protein